MEWKTVVMAILVVSLCFFAIPVRITTDKNTEDVKLFEQYVARYNKSYKQNLSEYSERFEHFQNSLRQIEKLNSLRSSQESAYYGLTEFSDMSETEFLAQALQPELWINSKKHTAIEGFAYHVHEHRHRHSGRNHNLVKRAVTGIPLKIDWRDKGVVTPVRAQGTCGACWAFSTIEVIESMFAIKNGSLQSLSVQEMIDCAGNSNFGCDGGDICSLLMWLMTTKTKVLAEVNYPLTWMTDKCQLKKDTSSQGVKVTDYTCDNFVGAENELLATIATHGPVAAAVNALSWQHYLGGVIQYHCDGSFTNLNHAVQIIGYDKSAAIPHYIIKNSWGPKFGDKGYIYIAIDDNVCGVANQVSSVDVI